MDLAKFKNLTKDLTALYYDYCNQLAHKFLQRFDNNEFKKAEEFHHEISQAMQDDEWLHNPDLARCVLFVSRCRDNYENFHRIEADNDHNKAWHAFRLDVEQALTSLLYDRSVTLEKPWACKTCRMTHDSVDSLSHCEHPDIEYPEDEEME